MGISSLKQYKLLWSLIFLAFIGIGVHLATTIFSRMALDDYCMAASAEQYGAVGNTVLYYYSWTGPFTNVFIRSLLVNIFDTQIYWLFPIVLYVSWFCLTYWCLLPLLRSLGFQKISIVALTITTFSTLMFMTTVPSQDGLYWYSVMVPYLLSGVCLTVYFGVMLRIKNLLSVPLIAVASFTVGFLVAGFSESHTTFQITLSMLLWLVVWFSPALPNRRMWLWGLGALCVGSGFSLIITLMGPGLAIRQQFRPVPIVWSESFLLTISKTLELIFAPYFIGIFLAIVLVSVWLFRYLNEGQQPIALASALKILGISLLGFAMCVFATCFPIILGSAGVPPRAVLLLHWVYLLLAMFWGYILSRVLVKIKVTSSTANTITLVLAVSLLGMFAKVGGNSLIKAVDLPLYQQNAEEWDTRHVELHQAVANGAKVIDAPLSTQVFGGRIWGGDLPPDSIDYGWVTACMTRFYQLELLTLNTDSDELRVIR
jgi:hypothetical protein